MSASVLSTSLASYVSGDSGVTFGEALDTLRSLSDSYGFSFSDESLLRVVCHLSLMLNRNRVVNLTSITDVQDGLVLHCLDSLFFCGPLLELGCSYARPANSSVTDSSSNESLHSFNVPVILDMGTGGGFPGLPIACALDCRATLVDSVGKKVTACQEFVTELGLSSSVRAVHSRLEDLGKAPAYISSCDFVVARALASLDVLVEYGSPLLKKGGYLILGKGSPSDEEVNHSLVTADMCGLEPVSRETFELSHDFGHREFYILQKVRKPSIKLPRQNGEAKKKPLWSMNI